MTCERVEFSPGQFGFVCGTRSRDRCVGCGKRANLECDWKVSGRNSGTCDKPICASCSTSPAPEKDLCPDHARQYQAWLASRNPERTDTGARS